MRHYELLVVLSPMLNQEQVTETWDRVKGFITTRDAEISHEEQWGTRRLAYPIRKGPNQFLEGSYHLTRFATDRSFNRELENFLKVDDEVIRSMVTVTLPEEELAAQAAAAARAIRPPPPRPAPMNPEAAPVAPAATAPADGEAPAATAPADGEAPAATALTDGEAPESPQVSEATVEVASPVVDDEPPVAEEINAATEDNDSPAEETAEPASGQDESEA